ncbi:GGDEF domain-containing protein [Shewanella olleyana]|uniref:tetratricopeptide repeat-containing diguanylate cyclase n=1 Tax=Shewanella olleyana TaxID=135626 RepID=UPI00200D5BFF|nr:GGDEF domain-containing protein [Shewanella olleyana]MCL1065726.1 GGDEF domain-containing protein [Shewanella olleyana]
MKLVIYLIFALLLLVIAPSWADGRVDVDKALSQADSVRSRDAIQFNKLLLDLDYLEPSFTPEQSDYFQYLKAYQIAFKGNFVEAQKIWQSLSESNTTIEVKLRANVSLLNTMALSKQWSKGLTYIEKLLADLHLVKDPALSQMAISVISYFYNKIGQYELALQYAQKLNAINLQGQGSCVAEELILESKFYLNALQLNSPEINSAISACTIDNEIVWLSVIYTFMARLHLDNGDSDLAIKLLQDNLAPIEDINYVPTLSHYYSLLASSYIEEREYTKAKDFGLKTIALSSGMNNMEPEMIAYEALYKVAVESNDFEDALKYYIKFAEADKTYFDDLKTKYLAFQLAQHKAVEQKVQIELLNKQNKLLKASQRLADSETENNRLFMALLIMVISLLAIAAIRSNRNQKRLRHLAEYDSLTQIYNRGHFTSAAQDAMVACQTNQDDISCILFDLDKFKTINDDYGHACGDRVLKTVASTCKSIGRKNDIFARLGGEEFCIILSRCDANTAMKIAEDYRKAIAEIDSAPSGNTFPITASFGVTDSHQSGYSLEALTGHADNAMYLAKDTGRNQVCNYADVVAKNDAESVVI